MADILDETKERMNKTINVLKSDLSSLRAGRANAQVLDRIMVDYWGTMTPITQLGNISTPEPRMLIIALWDTKMISAVEKAIQKSDLGINPANDGKVIRLIFPELTEERRKDLVKTVRKKRRGIQSCDPLDPQGCNGTAEEAEEKQRDHRR